MMKLRKSRLLALVLYLLCFRLQAQSFRHQALTDTVRQTGFYSIPITPELSAYMQTDFSDVRIWDQKGKQVPYIVRGRKPTWQNSLFKPFPIVENGLDDSANSIIVFEKSVVQPISQFWIIQKNSTVLRQAYLSGSNDRKNWFIIEQNILLNNTYETLADSNFQSVQFTPSNYTYLRLVIDNEKKTPLNITAVGYYTNGNYVSQLSSTINPAPSFLQIDSSDGYSYIKVTQQQPYPITSIGFENIGQKYFTRTLRLMIPSNKAHAKREQLTEWSHYVLTSDAISVKSIPVFKSKEFYLVLYNGDNPPIEPDSITTAQDYHEIVAYLQADNQYKLVMNAENATAPHYDLQQFADSIPAIVTPLAIKPITAITNPDSSSTSAAFPRQYIWLIMAGVVALLSFLTWKLTTEMRKNV